MSREISECLKLLAPVVQAIVNDILVSELFDSLAKHDRLLFGRRVNDMLV